MRQTEEILARFPGPVTLTVSLRRRWLGLAVAGGLAAMMGWLVLDAEMSRRYLSSANEPLMAWLALVVLGALAARAVILLFVPRAASLTLDGEGFTIGHVFHRVGAAWADVNAFTVETSYGRGGRLRQVMYEDLGAWRRGGRLRRIVPEVYGRPRLHGEELADLMNAWRERALAQSGPGRDVAPVPPGGGVVRSAPPSGRR